MLPGVRLTPPQGFSHVTWLLHPQTLFPNSGHGCSLGTPILQSSQELCSGAPVLGQARCSSQRWAGGSRYQSFCKSLLPAWSLTCLMVVWPQKSHLSSLGSCSHWKWK